MAPHRVSGLRAWIRGTRRYAVRTDRPAPGSWSMAWALRQFEAKGMFYPMFMVWSHWAAMPLKVAEQLVYLVVAAVIGGVVRRRTGGNRTRIRRTPYRVPVGRRHQFLPVGMRP